MVIEMTLKKGVIFRGNGAEMEEASERACGGQALVAKRHRMEIYARLMWLESRDLEEMHVPITVLGKTVS